MELKLHILLPTTTALFVFSCFATATYASDHREEDKQLRTIELSTHSLSVSWRNFDERARSFIATIHPIDSGENTLVTQRVDAIKTCLLVYINESFATWTDLVPGKTYTVSVVSVNAIEEISTYEQRDVTTKPMPPASLTAEPFVTSNADEFGYMEMLEHVPTYGLYVDWKNPVIGLFDHFMVAIYPPHGKIKRRVYYENEYLHQESEEESGVPLRVRRYLDNSLDRIIWDLVPGVHYDILVTSESNGVQSDSASVGRRIPPETPGTIKVESLTETQVHLSWEGTHRGIIDDFRIYLTPPMGSVVNPTDRTMKTRIIRMLTPGTKYDAEIFSLSNDTQSMEGSAVTFTTPPLEPADLRTPQITSKFIDLYWPKPEGHVDYYHVVYYPENDPSAEEGQMKVDKNNVRLDDLKEDTEYYIRVSSVSNGVYSPPVSVTNRTKPIPSDPAEVSVVPGGIEGENSTGAHVECTSKEILLYLDKTRFGRYEVEYGPLHFGNGSDPNCYAEKSFSKEESYYLYRIGPNLSSCNTDTVRNQTHANLTNILNNDKRRNEWLNKVTDASRTVIFGNKLMSAENNGKVVSRFSMRIWCTYPTNYTVKTDYDNVELEMLVLRWSVRGKGEFAARMRLFQSELFEVPYRYAPKLNMSDNIYAEIELLDQAVQGTKVVVKKCWATPTENHDYPVKYTIIEEGCPIKETMNNQLVIYENGVARHVRWQGPVFGFIDEKQVWLHCSIQVCFDDIECVPDCSFEGKRRRKRNNLALEAHVISTGPIRSVKLKLKSPPKVNEDILPEVDNQPALKKSNSLVIAAIIILLLIIAASCAVIFGLGWKMRRSIPSKKLSFSNKSIFPPSSDLACIPVPALADRSLFPSSLSSTSVTTEFGKEDPEPTTKTTTEAATKDVAGQDEEEEGDVEKL